jgi:hypothetical protein
MGERSGENDVGIELNTSKALVRIGGYILAEHIISVPQEHVPGYARGSVHGIAWCEGSYLMDNIDATRLRKEEQDGRRTCGLEEGIARMQLERVYAGPRHVE